MVCHGSSADTWHGGKSLMWKHQTSSQALVYKGVENQDFNVLKRERREKKWVFVVDLNGISYGSGSGISCGSLCASQSTCIKSGMLR